MLFHEYSKYRLIVGSGTGWQQESWDLLEPGTIKDSGAFPGITMTLISATKDQDLTISPYYTQTKNALIAFDEAGLKLGISKTNISTGTLYSRTFGFFGGRARVSGGLLSSNVGKKSASFSYDNQWATTSGYYFERYKYFWGFPYLGWGVEATIKTITVEGEKTATYLGVTKTKYTTENFNTYRIAFLIVLIL